MGSLVGKSPASTYKSLLKTADETNGISTTGTNIEDGEGTKSCITISDDILSVMPQNDNTTTTFNVDQQVDLIFAQQIQQTLYLK